MSQAWIYAYVMFCLQAFVKMQANDMTLQIKSTTNFITRYIKIQQDYQLPLQIGQFAIITFNLKDVLYLALMDFVGKQILPLKFYHNFHEFISNQICEAET
eukprot:TRINITY_DN3228_c0_g1_i5.p8 TRINITY_DN3228_c0_g1~~TRINITY_DN3228_c0_g1_i5.p8  ORF type:complete len:101 (-),score=1.81 TRINITY_DN3228_c0_g1_i5:42-344(-)